VLSGLQDGDPGGAEADNDGRHNETVDDTRNAGNHFSGDDNVDDHFDDYGAVDDPTVLARTELAKVAREYICRSSKSSIPTDIYW
jgi:hypothetical protein